MKSNYSFNLLTKEEIPPDLDKEFIFLKMQHAAASGKLLLVADSVIGLADFLDGSTYYLAHNLVARKGKKVVFKGKLAIATKENIIRFIRQSIDCGDLRPLLISPVFEEQPDYVVHVDEDGVFIKYANQTLGHRE